TKNGANDVSRSLRFLRLQNLAAAVHARLQVDVVWTAQLTGILVLDVGRSLQGIGRTAHAALGRRSLSFRYCHDTLRCSTDPSAESALLPAEKIEFAPPIHGLDRFGQWGSAHFSSQMTPKRPSPRLLVGFYTIIIP